MFQLTTEERTAMRSQIVTASVPKGLNAMASMDTNVLVSYLRDDIAHASQSALAHVAGENPLWTFDKSASKVDGAKLLV